LLHRRRLDSVDKVLIHAGSGGVGTYAIQIAKHFGAYVATTTSAKNAELVKSLGADLIIDYKTTRFEDAVSDYDLVIDMLGGEALENSFKVVKKGGSVISIKGQDTDGLATKYGVHFESFFMSPDGKMLAELGALISDNIVKPVIDSVFPMKQTAVAYGQLASGRTVGKIVISVK
jgi:NADPH:quinone reductase-like Zn-dependent oxidoreductase